jgi:hypothetical protein
VSKFNQCEDLQELNLIDYTQPPGEVDVHYQAAERVAAAIGAAGARLAKVEPKDLGEAAAEQT